MNNVTLLVRMSPELKQQLREHAARQARSMSAVVKSLIQAEMQIATGLQGLSDREAELIDAHVSGEHPMIGDNDA